ncbi:MAG: hypothetical protein K9N06_00795 [Candidatus Cloacimonetes bacterium]|nr:hypothetical protein [Candidatus Cloacimonadota bacterium]
MESEKPRFYSYQDIVLCLDEIKSIMVRHKQADWYLEVVYTSGTLISYMCRHKDEAQRLFSTLAEMLNAEKITLEEIF